MIVGKSMAITMPFIVRQARNGPIHIGSCLAHAIERNRSELHTPRTTSAHLTDFRLLVERAWANETLDCR